MSEIAHPIPETLLLLALGADVGGGAAAGAIADHAARCAACGKVLDRMLEARFAETDEDKQGTENREQGIQNSQFPVPCSLFPVAPGATRALPGAPVRAGDSCLSPNAKSGRALRAAAADARTFDAPAAPALIGAAWLADGDAVSVFRRPDAPSTFALDRRDLFGRRVTIRAASGGGPSTEADVDRFGRMRLAAGEADALARRFASGEKIVIALA